MFKLTGDNNVVKIFCKSVDDIPLQNIETRRPQPSAAFLFGGCLVGKTCRDKPLTSRCFGGSSSDQEQQAGKAV